VVHFFPFSIKVKETGKNTLQEKTKLVNDTLFIKKRNWKMSLKKPPTSFIKKTGHSAVIIERGSIWKSN